MPSFDDYADTPPRSDDGDPRYLVIWNALTDGADFETPEGVCDVDARLRAFLATVHPECLRHQYEATFRTLRATRCRDAGGIVRAIGDY